MQYDWANKRKINGILTPIKDGMILRQGGIFFIFFIIIDKTIKHKLQYFHINQINSKKYFFARGVPRRGGGQTFYFLYYQR